MFALLSSAPHASVAIPSCFPHDFLSCLLCFPPSTMAHQFFLLQSDCIRLLMPVPSHGANIFPSTHISSNIPLWASPLRCQLLIENEVPSIPFCTLLRIIVTRKSSYSCNEARTFALTKWPTSTPANNQNWSIFRTDEILREFCFQLKTNSSHCLWKLSSTHTENVSFYNFVKFGTTF